MIIAIAISGGLLLFALGVYTGARFVLWISISEKWITKETYLAWLSGKRRTRDE